MNAAIRALNQSDVNFNDWSVAIRSGGKLNLLGIINEVTRLGGLKLNEPFTKLSRANFLEALSLARAIREPQSSLIAQVAVCRARLNKTPGSETKETSSLSKVALQ